MIVQVHGIRCGFFLSDVQTGDGVDKRTQWRLERPALAAKLKYPSKSRLASVSGFRQRHVQTNVHHPKYRFSIRALRSKENRKGFRSDTPPDEFPRGSSKGPMPSVDDEELPKIREYTRRKESSPLREDEEIGGWEYRQSPSRVENGVTALTQGVNRYVLGGLFVLGMGAGIAVDTVLNVEPNNIASREVIDRQTPNPDVCIANGMSAMVLDQRLFITFNPFNVYVSQAEVKPGCVLLQSNWRVLESRGLVNSEEVRDCKRNFNTFGFVGDLRQAPEINCVYHSEAAENQFLKDPSKAALGDGFQPKDFTPE
ncbi:hypothetical protein MPTK1_5g04690 [Marchantia polymorpha subsp. ruderalis]|uniref:DUF3172 domain-containing protein n=2 Tax=Marchantia polymorpha TaxID=3197 RepID=A0A176W7G5_MARPO|nr:hypothetical protein AXG93_115s1010 [Marchantia polymorpha subsp. ruderalis]PTQ43059.1 hypothetical protein MARPO_0027s0158 [Marchantia polymorpha]BBN10576.1 hypothetical protein Mp_5g04690 [Marchantia polymorpha subsp. ruderalis]|eukprot:PTQ43059.1 hypothetical protein MARPO_0027s0158 [Marchantia polymorpha]